MTADAETRRAARLAKTLLACFGGIGMAVAAAPPLLPDPIPADARGAGSGWSIETVPGQTLPVTGFRRVDTEARAGIAHRG